MVGRQSARVPLLALAVLVGLEAPAHTSNAGATAAGSAKVENQTRPLALGPRRFAAPETLGASPALIGRTVVADTVRAAVAVVHTSGEFQGSCRLNWV